VRVSGLHLKNEARWGFTFTYCHNVIAENLIVKCDDYIPSSDGFDIDSSKHVLITGCSIDCFDEDITLKSGKDDDGRRVNIPCEDIVIEKTRFGSGDGGAAMGSETSGGIRNVLVRDCIADPPQKAPIRFKSQVTRGGVVENITYENITLNDIGEVLEFNLAWSSAPSAGVRMPPTVRNVKIINVHGLASTGGVIAGLPDSLISNVTFENCDVTTYTGLRLSDVTGILAPTAPGAPLSIPGLKINSEDGNPIVMRTTPGAPTAADITGNPQAADAAPAPAQQ
jgi:polygalacturonase